FSARILDRLAASLALRTGTFDREEALAGAHLAVAGAHRAVYRLGAGFGAATRTFGTGDRGRHVDLCSLTRKCLFQRDFHVVAQVGAALAAAGGAASPAAHHVAENVLEDVGETAGAKTMATAVHAAL